MTGSRSEPPRLPRNPFTTRMTAPGRLPPLDAAGSPVDLGRVLDALQPGVSMIEGPHGHGKTTLLRAVCAEADSRHRPFDFLAIRSISSALTTVTRVLFAGQHAVVAVDGWEELPAGFPILIRILARWKSVVVVATAHAPAGVPVVARCVATPAILAAIVGRLPDHHGLISQHDLDEVFVRHAGNLREALYDLYDRFERRAAAGVAHPRPIA